MKKVILFASGSGSNVENIIGYFKEKQQKISFYVFTNNEKAFVLERARKHQVPAVVFSREEMNEGKVGEKVKEINPDLIVLAGFLWKFPSAIIAEYPNKIINIHPALLPKYGGKGMYGKFVHEAVLLNKEKETGITIHYVNEHYDDGAPLFQAKVALSNNDTVEQIADKVHQLEFIHFPKIIEKLLKD